MIKTGGENAASREVEEAIYEMDGVAEVAVCGIAHPHWVEAVTAVVVLKDGANLTTEDIRAHAQQRLAGYKRPKYVVMVAELPKNPSGKILKRELRQQYAGLAREG
jgi:fatty-acyl-CoA synthase